MFFVPAEYLLGLWTSGIGKGYAAVMTPTALHRPPSGKAGDKQARSRTTRQPDPFRYGWRFERVRTADGGGRYRPMEADDHGRLFSATTDLYFGSDPAHRRLVVQDAGSGQPLLHPEQQRAALKDNRRRAAEATERAAKEARARRQAELRAAEASERAAEEAAARRALQAELEQLRSRLKPHEE